MNELAKEVLNNFSVDSVKKFIQECINSENYEIIISCSQLFSRLSELEILSKLAFAHEKQKNFEEAFELYEKMQNFSSHISSHIFHEILEKKLKLISEIKNNFCFYDYSKVSKILYRSISRFPLITFSITTCKRLSLFEKTMNSFLNCCQDIEKIDNWICIDDNSDENDRERMRRLYPFFTFIFKTEKDKGHSDSMNRILKNVTTPYLFHMEDDWQFFSKDNYISKCFSVLNSSENIAQCLVNRGYAETEKDINIAVGDALHTIDGVRYCIHEQAVTEDQKNKLLSVHGDKPNCWYWPHFSLRPGMWKLNNVKSIGKFSDTAAHFEMDFGNRYAKKYVSAFLDNISCLHIGRLTSERFSDKPNAYTLNNVEQFRERVFEEKVEMLPPQKPKTLKTYVINLERRKDRLEKMQNLQDLKFLRFGKFTAVDGLKLKSSERLHRIFDGNDYRMKAGMVGCALSHVQLYIQMLRSNIDVFCILEDDITLVPDFQLKFTRVYQQLDRIEWDLCYLGHHMWPGREDVKAHDKETFPRIKLMNTSKSFDISMGGTIGYLISRKGAENMLNFLNNGFTNAIDTMQQKAADTLKIYYCFPHLVYSSAVPSNPNADSDIHHDRKFLCTDIEKRCEDEKKLYLEKNLEIPNFEFVEKEKIKERTNEKIKNLSNYYVMHGQIGESSVIVSGENLLPYYRLKKGDIWDISEIL